RLARIEPSMRMLIGHLAARASIFTAPLRFLSFLRSYSFRILLSLLGRGFARTDNSNHTPFRPFAIHHQEKPPDAGETNADETVFLLTMLGIIEFERRWVRPYRLRLLKPNRMLLEVGRILVLIPFKLHMHHRILLY